MRAFRRALRSVHAVTWIAWSLAAVGTAFASARPTYREAQLGLPSPIEWGRVAFVCAILAAELLAAERLVRAFHRSRDRGDRALLAAIGAGVAMALSLTIRPHGPDEVNAPGRLAVVLLLAGAVGVLVAGVVRVVRRSPAP